MQVWEGGMKTTRLVERSYALTSLEYCRNVPWKRGACGTFEMFKPV